MQPLDPKQRFHEVHPDDLKLEPEHRTTWVLRALSARESAFIRNLAAQITVDEADPENEARQNIELRTGDVELWRLRLGLAGVENFPAWKSIDNPVDKTMPRIPTLEFLNTIPDHVRAWAVGKIANLAKLTVEEAGKSSPRSTSSGTADTPPAAKPEPARFPAPVASGAATPPAP